MHTLAYAVIVLAIVNLGMVWAWWQTARRLDRQTQTVADLTDLWASQEATRHRIVSRVQFLETQGQKLAFESKQNFDMHEAAARFIVDHTERIMRLEQGVVVGRGGRYGRRGVVQ